MKPPMIRRAVLLLLLLTGCHRDEITVYTVPKEKAGESAEEAGSSQAALGYALPEGWKEEAPDGMTVLKLAFPETGDARAEVSVMQFPAKGIPTLQLINIAREKVGLPEMTEEEYSRDTEPVAIGSEKGSLIDLGRPTASPTNDTVGRIMLAVYPRADITWYFKLAGDAATVAAQKPAFIQFLKSVSFREGEAPMLDSHKGGGTNAKLPPGTAPGPEPGAGLPEWKVPAGWQEMPPSAMLRAKFEVSGKDGAKAEINIGVAGGAPIMNVNRWRGQLGLPTADGNEFAKLVTGLDVPDGKAMLVDMTGTDAKTGHAARMVGVIVPRSEGTWFYKLMGDTSVVEAEKAKFVEFVKTVNYGHAP
jgi:hypothetical protein